MTANIKSCFKDLEDPSITQRIGTALPLTPGVDGPGPLALEIYLPGRLSIKTQQDVVYYINYGPIRIKKDDKAVRAYFVTKKSVQSSRFNGLSFTHHIYRKQFVSFLVLLFNLLTSI